MEEGGIRGANAGEGEMESSQDTVDSTGEKHEDKKITEAEDMSLPPEVEELGLVDEVEEEAGRVIEALQQSLDGEVRVEEEPAATSRRLEALMPGMEASIHLEQLEGDVELVDAASDRVKHQPEAAIGEEQSKSLVDESLQVVSPDLPEDMAFVEVVDEDEDECETLDIRSTEPWNYAAAIEQQPDMDLNCDDDEKLNRINPTEIAHDDVPSDSEVARTGECGNQAQQVMTDLLAVLPELATSPGAVEAVIQAVTEQVEETVLPEGEMAEESDGWELGVSEVGCEVSEVAPKVGEELCSATCAAISPLACGLSPEAGGSASAVCRAADSARPPSRAAGAEPALEEGGGGMEQEQGAEEGGGGMEQRAEGVEGKSSELKEWLLVKEREFDHILGGDTAEEKLDVMEVETNLEEEIDNVEEVEETTTELMDELELQSEILRQITENASALAGEDQEVEEGVRDVEEVREASGRPMAVPRKKKPKSSGSKSMKAKHKSAKSPLLRRSEIRTCLELHQACETAEILQELLEPAVTFGGEGREVEEVEEEPFIQEVTWTSGPPREPVSLHSLHAVWSLAKTLC